MSLLTVPCECTEHRCQPVPGQTERYRVNTGPFNQGVVKLCPFCFVNGHEWMKEQRAKWARERAAKWAEEAANNG